MSGLIARLITAIAGTTIGVAAVTGVAVVLINLLGDPAADAPELVEELIAIAVFAAIILIAVSWDVLSVVRESVSEPLRHLTQMSQRMANGKFDVPIEASSSSSLGELTAALEHMRANTEKELNRLTDKNAELTLDVTERMEKLGNAALDLMEANEIKDRFLGMAAHDLRNPINAVRMMTEMLSTMEVEEETRHEFYKNMNRSAHQMLSLINDLLDVSAIESGTFHMSPVEANLKEEIQERVRMQQMTAERKKISISVDEDDMPDSVFDTNRIGQVVDNLVSNAVKFSPPGTEINLHLWHDDDRVGFAVEDEGPGIPDNERDKLFQEFARLSNAPTAGESSTGLGLSIVKKIIESHKGSIDFESKVGQGTKFLVSLPRKLEIKKAGA